MPPRVFQCFLFLNFFLPLQTVELAFASLQNEIAHWSTGIIDAARCSLANLKQESGQQRTDLDLRKQTALESLRVNTLNPND